MRLAPHVARKGDERHGCAPRRVKAHAPVNRVRPLYWLASATIITSWQPLCPFRRPPASWSVVVTAVPHLSRGLCCESPSVSVPPPRGLLGREILIFDRVGRFDSPVTRRAGALAGTSSLSYCGGRHCAVLALGNVLLERSPTAKDTCSSMRKCPLREVSNWRGATRSGRPHMERGTKP